MKIVTHYEFPPIPVRHFDWCAHYDDPEGDTGWGATEDAAISDLLQNHPRGQMPCKAESRFVDVDGSCLRCGIENAFVCGDRSKCQPSPTHSETG